MELLKTVSVKVRRPRATGTDRFGNPVVEFDTEEVPGALVAPGASSDLDPARPDGSRIAATVHFPKSYAKRLKGCEVVAGARTLRVIGDPQPYAAENCPGPFGLAAECEAVDG